MERALHMDAEVVDGALVAPLTTMLEFVAQESRESALARAHADADPHPIALHRAIGAIHLIRRERPVVRVGDHLAARMHMQGPLATCSGTASQRIDEHLALRFETRVSASRGPPSVERSDVHRAILDA
jgi:hypothetical protein